MVDDQHGDADDVTDADDDFEAAVGNFAPGLLARVGSGALTRGMSGAVAVMPGLGARGDDGGSRQGALCATVFGSLWHWPTPMLQVRPGMVFEHHARPLGFRGAPGARERDENIRPSLDVKIVFLLSNFKRK